MEDPDARTPNTRTRGRRLLVVAAVLGGAALFTASAWAASMSGDRSDVAVTTPADVSSAVAAFTPDELAAGVTFDAADAGRVTITWDGSTLAIVDVTPAAGWRGAIDGEDEGPFEAEAHFRQGDARVDFNAEIEDGALRIRIRDRRTDTIDETFFSLDGTPVVDEPGDDHDGDDDSSGSNSGPGDDSGPGNGSGTTVTTPTTVTSTTIDDHGNDDDGGDDDGGDDDDRSGPGGGDEDDDDDNSGPSGH